MERSYYGKFSCSALGRGVKRIGVLGNGAYLPSPRGTYALHAWMCDGDLGHTDNSLARMAHAGALLRRRSAKSSK